MNTPVQNDIRSTVQIQPDSAWFDGHFPGNPVLPGIAQLSVVFDAVRKALDGRPGIKGFKKVKFKQIIKPGDALDISATPDAGGTGAFSFQITVKDEIVCRGIMTTQETV